MPLPTVFKIRAGETRTLTVDFADKLPATVGFGVTGHTVACTDHYSGESVPAILSSGSTPTVSGTDVSVVLTGVALHKRYDIDLTLTLNDATPSVIVENVLVIGVETL